MRLQSIEQFIAVVDAGSIRGAARQLNMSQPTLSRALQQLEGELGVQLMDRSGRGVTPTAAGSALLSRARVAEAELRKAAEEAKRAVGDATRLLALGVSPVGASLLLPELVITLQGLPPATRIRILETTPSALLSLVHDEVMDLAVTQRTRIHLDAGWTASHWRRFRCAWPCGRGIHSSQSSAKRESATCQTWWARRGFTSRRTTAPMTLGAGRSLPAACPCGCPQCTAALTS